MKCEDFVDFLQGTNFTNLKKPVDAEGEKFNWLMIHEFRYEKDLFGFKFRYNLDDPYRKCSLGPKRTPRQKNPKPVFTEAPLLHPNGRKLAGPKVLDLQTLMQFVPLIYQGFYQQIIDNHEEEIKKCKAAKSKKGKKKRKQSKKQSAGPSKKQSAGPSKAKKKKIKDTSNNESDEGESESDEDESESDSNDSYVEELDMCM